MIQYDSINATESSIQSHSTRKSLIIENLINFFPNGTQTPLKNLSDPDNHDWGHKTQTFQAFLENHLQDEIIEITSHLNNNEIIQLPPSSNKPAFSRRIIASIPCLRLGKRNGLKPKSLVLFSDCLLYCDDDWVERRFDCCLETSEEASTSKSHSRSNSTSASISDEVITHTAEKPSSLLRKGFTAKSITKSIQRTFSSSLSFSQSKNTTRRKRKKPKRRSLSDLNTSNYIPPKYNNPKLLHILDLSIATLPLLTNPKSFLDLYDANAANENENTSNSTNDITYNSMLIASPNKSLAFYFLNSTQLLSSNDFSIFFKLLSETIEIARQRHYSLTRPVPKPVANFNNYNEICSGCEVEFYYQNTQNAGKSTEGPNDNSNAMNKLQKVYYSTYGSNTIIKIQNCKDCGWNFCKDCIVENNLCGSCVKFKK